MALILYANKKEPWAEQLRRAVERVIPEQGLEVYDTAAGLRTRLRQPGNEVQLAVLAAANHEDLSDLLSFRELLSDIRTIVILPDRDPETASKAHTLLPRFLTYFDDGFEDLRAVLRKMLVHSRSKSLHQGPSCDRHGSV